MIDSSVEMIARGGVAAADIDMKNGRRSAKFDRFSVDHEFTLELLAQRLCSHTHNTTARHE
jgi:hypothetical protein